MTSAILRCPACAKVLPEAQAKVLGQERRNGEYSPWFLAGYCSYACHTATQGAPEPKSAPSPPNPGLRLRQPPAAMDEPSFEAFPLDDSRQARWEILSGLGLTFLGALVTGGTYYLASARLTQPYVVIAYGPLLCGVGRLCQGLFDYAMLKWF